MAQVEGGVRWMLKAGAQEAQLQLHPESLGQITIHLKVEGGEVHARLWVTEPASVQAVQEGRPHLELSLKEQGLQLGSFDLQQGQRPFQEAPSTPNHRDHVTPEALAARQEAPAAAPVSILNAHRVELYA
jgi:flagellar hook-length control protein FliK